MWHWPCTSCRPNTPRLPVVGVLDSRGSPPAGWREKIGFCTVNLHSSSPTQSIPLWDGFPPPLLPLTCFMNSVLVYTTTATTITVATASLLQLLLLLLPPLLLLPLLLLLQLLLAHHTSGLWTSTYHLSNAVTQRASWRKKCSTLSLMQWHTRLINHYLR